MTSSRAWAAVGAVAVGTFTLVTNEFLPVGVLPSIAGDLRVSIGLAGTMMTAPGIVAAFAAPFLTVAAGRIDRRVFLVAMSLLFTAADVLGGLAPNFAVMLLARFLLGLGIGGFWAIAGTLGTRLIGGPAGARANAIIFSGVSIASVIGVPAGALIGNAWGWRTAFFCTAGLGAISLVGQLLLLPQLGVEKPVTWRQLGTVLTGHNARIGLIVTVLLVIGQFTAYTYVTPFLGRVTGLSGAAIGGLLFGYGAAGIIGNFAIGGLLRRRLLIWAATDAALVAVSIALLPVLGTNILPAGLVLIVWGAAYGAVPIAMQTWVFTSDATQSESGSALYISAFQVSVAGGSLLGGTLVDRLDTGPTMLIGAALAAAAVLTLVFASTPVARSARDAIHPQAVKSPEGANP